VSSNTGGNARVPEDDLKKLSTEVWRYRPLLLLQNLLTLSKYPHNSLSSCCCLLLVPFIVLRHPDASLSVSSSHSANFQTVMVLSLGSGSGSSASRAFSLRIPTVWPRVSYWSWEFSDLKTSSAY